MTDKTNTHALPVWTEVEYTRIMQKPVPVNPILHP